MIIKPKKKFFGRRYPISPREGELVETVVLKYPDLVNWMSEKDAPHGSEWLPDYIQKCVDLFDAMVFTKSCNGKAGGQRCVRTATRFALYPDSAEPTYWCAACDPFQLGASDLTISNRYYDALFHIDEMDGTRVQARSLIRALAQGKGYSGNFTELKIVRFFYGPEAELPPEENEEGV